MFFYGLLYMTATAFLVAAFHALHFEGKLRSSIHIYELFNCVFKHPIVVGGWLPMVYHCQYQLRIDGYLLW